MYDEKTQKLIFEITCKVIFLYNFLLQRDSNNYIEFAFYNQTHLISAQNLNFGNVTSIGQQGLSYCFCGCSSLTTAPDLSNVTIIGQSGLNSCFYGCSNLTTVTAPNISDLTANDVLVNWLKNAGGSATGTKTVNVPTGATIETNSR